MAGTNVQVFTYGGAEVEFDLSGQNVMINATEMARPFDKKVEAFMRNEQAQTFISECLKSENSRFLGVEKEEDLIVSKQKSGTWMHRILALKFAAWLDPAFELWVFKTIDEVIYGRYRRYMEEVERTARLEEELKALEEKKSDDPDFVRMLELKKLIAGSGKRRSLALNGTQYKLEFA